MQESSFFCLKTQTKKKWSKHICQKNITFEEFDRAVFESIVDKIIIGGTNDEGEIDPAMITIIYKTGKKDSQDGRLFKSRRKNAKEVNEETDNKLYPRSSDEVNNLCSYPMDNTCGDGSVTFQIGLKELY